MLNPTVAYLFFIPARKSVLYIFMATSLAHYRQLINTREGDELTYTERMKKQNWILEATFTQTTFSVVHQQRVTVVDRIAQLKREHSVSLQQRTTTA